MILALAAMTATDVADAFESSSFNAFVLHWQRNSGMWAFYVTALEQARPTRKRNGLAA